MFVSSASLKSASVALLKPLPAAFSAAFSAAFFSAAVALSRLLILIHVGHTGTHLITKVKPS
jgi:hypothetical protein